MRNLWSRAAGELGRSRRGAAGARNARDADTPWSRRRRDISRAWRGSRPLPPQHRGCGRWPSADVERRGVAPHRLQWRGLQPPRAPSHARGPGPSLPNRVRYRDGPAALCGGGTRGRIEAARNVRVRGVGRRSPRALPRARSARDQAPLLCACGRRRALLRIGDQGSARGRERSRRAEHECRAGLPRQSCTFGCGDPLRGRTTAACRPYAPLARRRDRTPALLGCFAWRGGRRASRRGADPGLRRALPRVRAHPAHGGRSPRRIPLRRNRLDRDHRRHERADGRAGEDLLGRLRRTRSERAGVCPHCGPIVRNRSPRGDARPGALFRAAPGHDLARGRATRPSLQHPSPRRRGARVRAREGGADGGGKRRAAGRLRTLLEDALQREAGQNVPAIHRKRSPPGAAKGARPAAGE